MSWLKLNGMKFLPGTTSQNTNKYSGKTNYNNYQFQRGKDEIQQISHALFLHTTGFLVFLCILG